MNDLLKKLQEAHGLSQEDAMRIMSTITEYIKEKFPMVSGAVDNLFQSGTTPSGPGTTPADVQTPASSGEPDDAVQKLKDLASENFSSFFGNKK